MKVVVGEDGRMKIVDDDYTEDSVLKVGSGKTKTGVSFTTKVGSNPDKSSKSSE